MSAFLLDKNHINAIITWAIDEGLLGQLTPQEWFVEFHSENITSLNYRYPDDREVVRKNWKYIPELKVIQPQKYRIQRAIAIAKLVGCWKYQCCEHGVDNNQAWQMMEKIEETAQIISGKNNRKELFNDPVYNIAPWAYNRKAWTHFISQLRGNQLD